MKNFELLKIELQRVSKKRSYYFYVYWLLKKLLSHFSSDIQWQIYGLCHCVNKMERSGYIHPIEQKILLDIIYDNYSMIPEESIEVSNGYFWPQGDKIPRIAYLTDIIERYDYIVRLLEIVEQKMFRYTFGEPGTRLNIKIELSELERLINFKIITKI